MDSCIQARAADSMFSTALEKEEDLVLHVRRFRERASCHFESVTGDSLLDSRRLEYLSAGPNLSSSSHTKTQIQKIINSRIELEEGLSNLDSDSQVFV